MMNSANDTGPALPSEAALRQAKALQNHEAVSEAPKVGVPWKFWLLVAVVVAVSAGGFFAYQQVYKKQAVLLLPKAAAELAAGRIEEGLALLREAAAAHNTDAQYQLAEVLATQYLAQRGRLPLRSDAGQTELFTQLDKAVNAGEPAASYLASILARAGGADQQHALALLVKAADSGLFIARLEASISLGKKYASQSVYLASLAESARKGWHVAQLEQSALAENKKDMPHARQWLEQAQKLGEHQDRLVVLRRALNDAAWQQMELEYRNVADYRLAIMIESDQPEAALSMLQKAAEAGLPAAELALSERYLEQQKGYWQPEKARSLLEKLVRRSSPLCHIDVGECSNSLVSQAKFKLALNHYLGVQGFDSVAQAFDYLKEGNEHGEADATYLMGWVLLNGRGIPMDVDRGVVLITQAAASGIAGAKVTLAKCYLQGLGVMPDPKKARVLLQQAAAQGDDEAISLLQKQGNGSNA